MGRSQRDTATLHRYLGIQDRLKKYNLNQAENVYLTCSRIGVGKAEIVHSVQCQQMVQELFTFVFASHERRTFVEGLKKGGIR